MGTRVQRICEAELLKYKDLTLFPFEFDPETINQEQLNGLPKAGGRGQTLG